MFGENVRIVPFFEKKLKRIIQGTVIEPRGDITLEKKRIIQEYVQKAQKEILSSSQKEHLQYLTGLNRSQINEVLRSITDPPREITEKKKGIIREWIQYNKKIPNREERDELIQKVDLSRKQLNELILQMRRLI